MNFYYELSSILSQINKSNFNMLASMYIENDMLTVRIVDFESLIYQYSDDINNIEDKAEFLAELKNLI